MPACAIAALWLAGVAGCASDSWLQTPYETELPLEPPAHRYPTAVHPSFKPPAGLVSAADSPPEPATAIESEQAKPAEPRLDKSQPPVTPLAAVPPQYRQTPKTAPAEAAATPDEADDADLPPIVSASGLARPSSLPPAEANTNETTEPPADDASASANLATALAAAASVVVPAAASEPEPTPPVITIPTDDTTADAPPADRSARVQSALNELIAALQADVTARQAENAADEELPRVEQRLRMVQLAAGRLDDAVQGIDSLDPSQREAYKHLMFALGVWLSPDEARRPPLRSAKVLRSLHEAATELSAASKLELKNLVFCERVEYFGWYSEFPRYEFRPKQPVILYVEVNNFTAEQKAAGYETELQGSYQIFDAAGRIVAERQLPLDREVCRNYRRDYFLAYPIYMPDSIPPGRYRLELSIEDLKAGSGYQGRKFGEGMIEFTIRP